jgi:hypothetical protein
LSWRCIRRQTTGVGEGKSELYGGAEDVEVLGVYDISAWSSISIGEELGSDQLSKSRALLSPDKHCCSSLYAMPSRPKSGNGYDGYEIGGRGWTERYVVSVGEALPSQS